MEANPNLDNTAVCRIHIAKEDEWARFALALGGTYTGGKIIETTTDFSGGIEGIDEIAEQYKLTNWLAGITSGALARFRMMKMLRRRVLLSQLSGILRASGMHTVAHATAFGISRLSGGDGSSTELNGWRIECEIASTAKQPVPERGEGQNGALIPPEVIHDLSQLDVARISK